MQQLSLEHYSLVFQTQNTFILFTDFRFQENYKKE